MAHLRQGTVTFILFLVPALFLYTLFFMYPSISSFFYGFTDWNGYSKSLQYIGLDNFKRMFDDDTLRMALWNTLLFAFFGAIIQNTIGIVLSIVLDKSVYTISALRAIYFAPVLFSPIVVGYMWSFMYSPQSGPINEALHAIVGFPLDFPWLMNFNTSLWSVLAVQIWIGLGISMAIYLAGLQNIPAELYESGEIDGAGRWARFRHITFPLLAPAFTVNMLLSVIGLLNQFDLVYVMTNGGPGNSSETVSTLLVKKLTGQDAGYGSAIGLVLFVMIVVIASIQLLILRRREVQL